MTRVAADKTTAILLQNINFRVYSLRSRRECASYRARALTAGNFGGSAELTWLLSLVVPTMRKGTSPQQRNGPLRGEGARRLLPRQL